MSEAAPIRVLVIDDHELFRDGIVGVIQAQPDMQVVGLAGDGMAAFVLAQQLCPDVVLLDINMPGTDGLVAARMIAQALPACHIVMLTVRDEDEQVYEAIRAGARGYLLKNIRAQQLTEMIRAAARGEAALTPALAARVLAEFRRIEAGPAPRAPAPAAGPAYDQLTFREQEILGAISAGRSDKEIAAQFGISLYTVKSHVRSILGKLQVNNRREAARRAR
jgi:DNA-binding NarL/FixJ family response regulator